MSPEPLPVENALLDIGEVVKASGIPTSTLHVWERKGLISAPGRVGLRRQYDPDVLSTIAIIVLCQRSGFTLVEIGELLEDDAFEDDKQPLVDKLAELRRMQVDLDQAISGLQHAIECPNPSPLKCSGFRAHLADVLPVDRSSASGSFVSTKD